MRTALGAGTRTHRAGGAGRKPGALAHRRRAGRGARVCRPHAWSSRRRRRRCRASRTSRSIRGSMAFAIAASLFSSMLFGALPALKHAAQHGAPARRRRARREHQPRTAADAQRTGRRAGGAGARPAGRLGPDDPDVSRSARRRSPGLRPRPMLQTARVWVPPQQVPDPERVTRMQHEILDKIAALPGVTAAAFRQRGADGGTAARVDAADLRRGTARRARDDAADASNEDRVARLFRRHRHADDRRARHHVERHLRTCEGGDRLRELRPRSLGIARGGAGSAHSRVCACARRCWREIVGIVEDVHEDALHQAAPAMVYWPVMMENFGGNRCSPCAPINLVIRSEQAGRESLLGGVRNAVSSVNPSMPVFLVRTMKDLYDAVDGADVVRAGDAGHCRRHGAGARRHRHLRRDRLRRRAALARDRHPPGARRRAGRARCGCSCVRGWR